MTLDEFFSEAERLNLRMLGTPEETRAALDMKDAEIARLRDELALCCELKREYQEQAAAAHAAALDCRTCRQHNDRVGGCMSVVRCVYGSAYQRAGVRQCWASGA
jgi:hypothetical protein